MKLLEITKSKITKDNISENASYLEINEVVLIYCNAVNNSYQQKSRVSYAFVPNKYFCQLLDIFPGNLIFYKNICFRIFVY